MMQGGEQLSGRPDLIGTGCDALIPAKPPKEALEKRRRLANEAVDGDHYHSVAKSPTKGERPGERAASPATSTGYWTGRKSQKRRKRL